MRLAEPAWLLLLLACALPWLRLRRRPRLAWPTFDGFAKAPRGLAGVARHATPLLQALAIAGMAVALARPQTVGGRVRIAGRGVAIVLALDHSSSMAAEDFPDPATGRDLSRLEAARRTIARFVEGRPDDLIGLVTFANYPDLACPPTLDHAFLVETARAIQPARPGDDGTNIGDAVAWSLQALRAASPEKKVLVLLTDGDNQPAVPAPLDPIAAARLARALGVTLHTVALGREGGVARRRESVTGLELAGEVGGPNFALLQEMADLGGGRMFSAFDAVGLAAVFRDIDRLERSPVQATVRTRYREWYPAALAVALAALTLDRLLGSGRLRRLP